MMAVFLLASGCQGISVQLHRLPALRRAHSMSGQDTIIRTSSLKCSQEPTSHEDMKSRDAEAEDTRDAAPAVPPELRSMSTDMQSRDAKAEAEDTRDAAPAVPPELRAVSEKKALLAAIADLEARMTAKRGDLLVAEERIKDAGENGYMLLAANFERSRQQATSEMKMQKTYGRVDTLRSLLPFFESFDSLLGGAVEGDDGSAIHKYFGGIYKQSEKQLGQWQAAPFVAAAGESYDWRLHEQVESIESAEVAAGVIVEARERGWMIGEELLRPAKVVISKGLPEPKPEA